MDERQLKQDDRRDLERRKERIGKLI